MRIKLKSNPVVMAFAVSLQAPGINRGKGRAASPERSTEESADSSFKADFS